MFYIKIFTIFFILISLYDDVNACGTYTVTQPPIMKSWYGYFDPRINFHNKCNGVNNVTPGEIIYQFPTHGWAFRGLCSADYADVLMDSTLSGRPEPHFTKAFGDNQSFVGTDKESEFYINPCMCVVELTQGTGDWANTYYGYFSGCIPIPLPPGPPPFCNRFSSSTKVNIVPDITSTYFSPKIRAVIGGKKMKLCSNGDKIINELSCPDGSVGTAIVSGYTLRPGVQKIIHLEEEYNFLVKIKNKEVCGQYYGNKDIKDENIVDEQCYEIPSMPKPEQLTINNLLNNYIQEGTIVNYKLYDKENNIYIDKSVRCCGEKNDDNLELIRPILNENYELKTEYLCINKNNQRSSAIFTNNQYLCNSDEQLTLHYADKKINASSACILGWKSNPDEFILKTKYLDKKGIEGKLRTIMITGENAFVPYTYESENKIWKIDYSKTPPLTIDGIISNQLNPQSILDSIDYLGSGIISMSVPKPSSNEQLTFMYQKKKFFSNNKTSNFANKVTDEAIFLNAEQLKNNEFKHYEPIPPNLIDLCVRVKSDKIITEYKKNEEQITRIAFNPNDDYTFIKMEAWSSGSNGFIDLKTSKSGDSGGYASGIISNNVKTFNNNGGLLLVYADNGSNEIDDRNTRIFLCNTLQTNYNNCSVLLNAVSAQNIKYLSNLNINFDAILNFPKNVYPRNGFEETFNIKNPNVLSEYDDKVEGFIVKKYETTPCFTANQGSSLSPASPGAGGCVSREKNIIQPGGIEKFVLKYEKW